MSEKNKSLGVSEDYEITIEENFESGLSEDYDIGKNDKSFIENNNDYLKKLKDMANLRDDFNAINVNNFILPTMGEMVQEDLMSEILQGFMDDEEYQDQEQGILDENYFTETPFSTELGYHPQENVFILKARKLNQNNYSWSLNTLDGDTTKFLIEDIEDGDEPFTFTNRMKYSSFKDYFKKMNGSDSLTVRHIGLNCPELPHIEIQAVPKDSKQFEPIEMKFKEVKELAKTNTKVTYLKYPVNGDKTKIIERKDDSIVKLLKITDDSGKVTYKEMLNTTLVPSLESIPNIKDSNDAYNYVPILLEDDSTAEGIIDGYNCQAIVRDTLDNASEIILMINANGINFGRTGPTSNMVLNSLYYKDDFVDFLLSQWNKSFNDLGVTNFTYKPYGCDAYGRSLGVVYVKENKNGETRWINLNKKVLAKSTHSEVNPSYTSSPELEAIGAGISDIFKRWSYDKSNLLYVDSFTNITRNSYKERIELHKKLTGIDFTKTRNCSLLIGDTMMLVPPESIRNITQVYYERVPNLRSKGTMTKQKGQNEHVLELTLYFYEDAGINGIEYNITTPSGDKLTYYMNGLRSLLAQFKITPFLPIENGYINDVLGVEAVSMQNINIQTVEGFPRLLRVVLTLREFNYRTFMPDLPVIDDNGEDEGNYTISELTPMFAKCFDWDIFRYYYQRSIMAGEVLNNMDFASYDYNLQFYTHKNTLERFDFCSPPGMGSKVSFYIPDEVWLQNALQVKKERDSALYTDTSYVDISERAKDFLEKLNVLNERIKELNDFSKNGEKLKQKFDKLFKDKQSQVHLHMPGLTKVDIVEEYTSNGKQKCIKRHNITDKDGDETFLNLWDGNMFGNTVTSHIEEIKEAFLEYINDTSYMKAVSVDESIFWNSNTTVRAFEVCWDFNIHLNTTNLTDTDISNIKEILLKNISQTENVWTIDNIFKDNAIRIRYMTRYNPPENEKLPEDIGSSWRWFDNYVCKPVLDNEGEIPINWDNKDPDYVVLQQVEKLMSENEDDEDASSDLQSNLSNKAIDFYVKDYKNPANMPFVPFLENVPVSAMSSNTSNTFTEISLKAIEGVGPQFLGGQDTTIELQILTDDIVVVSMLNNLPTMASAIAKKYRRILPAWPLKIRSEFTGLISVAEVLIDAIEVGTVDGYPGVYSIAMRLTSVDRTQRQREALRRLDVTPEGGNISVQSSNLAINKYFGLESALSKAELYPDLDLPTLEDMAKLGWKFVKYTGDNRVYPDPDFYITYAYPYSSLLIKKTVKDVLSKQLLSQDGNENAHSFKFSDVMGSTVTAKVEALTGLDVTAENSYAKNYEAILENHKKMIQSENEEGWTDEELEKINKASDELSLLNYLTMCDIADGWQIKPGYSAPLCDPSTNDAISQLNVEDNRYAFDVKQKRTKAIQLINEILAEPMDYVDSIDGLMEKTMPNSYQTPVEITLNKIFLNNKAGKELLTLLCPSLEMESLKATYDSMNSDYGTSFKLDYDKTFNKKYFKKTNPLAYLAGYLFAAGCAMSGEEQYKSNAKANRWHPSHYPLGEDIGVDDYWNSENYMPYVEIERKTGRTVTATDLDDAVNNGITFGAWRIRQYNAEDLTKIMSVENNSIDYNTEEYQDKIYGRKNKKPVELIQDGFLDPYYNINRNNTDEIKKYKKTIALSRTANCEAFLRNVLTYLKKMILDGLIFSELDIVLEDYNIFMKKYYAEKQIVIPASADTYQPEIAESYAKNELSALGLDQDKINELLVEIQNNFERALCARLIYPFLLAVSDNDPKVYNMLKSRNYTALSGLTGYVETSSQSGDANGRIFKFVAALAGCEMTLTNDNANEASASASASQQLMNSMMSDVYIQAAEDPRAYLLHSFYDMLTQDKRGRLVRAFPTYYMLFIDEGRKIGSWKLHDNFYNMSSISEIQVVKSRKIAADTCTITMSNMFNSYTTEPDITTTQQYIDLYGMKDVFYSIFSPQTYFEKEKALRLRQKTPDKVVLQPGVRIHVRMGYSGDGSKLPIVFNGKVAEVEVGDVAQIIAQGDGHELMNPLNAFGEIEANALDPAQSMCTWFQDLRGSLAKGGETPRDLVAKLLTAKYGGWKKVVNDVFDGRWFNDNPFGIMHFGDPRYNHIFGLGEPVQNLYEVSDTTLLKGVNELWSSRYARKTTPIINTSLQDKTFWDILHMCANSGIGYIGAIRDFGFRSTVFLGKPNHYYAYEYKMVDNKVVEKRKPFQQFHYYDSYNDIIYNGIKASEAQMKTNAVGLWQSSSKWWGREQSTVGPIYLDMNIYPEYQKSMTVDTGLLADGNGGLKAPFIGHYSEKWGMDVNDDKVNKSLAWRMTANALRDSVKDMYQGDMGIIGDPSVKPHDRVYIYDTYEDMKGMFEVEAVVHTMSAQNGFTTSIMPDVIARHQDEMEGAVQGLLNSVSATLIATVSSNVAHNLWMAAVNNKLAVTLAKSKTMYGSTMRLIEHAKNIGNATGMIEFLEKHPAAKQLFSSLNFVPSETNLNLNRFTLLIDAIANSKLSGNLADNFGDFTQAFAKFYGLDPDEFGEAMMNVYKSDKYGVAATHTEEAIQKAIDEMKETYASLHGRLNKSMNKINLEVFIDDIKRLNLVDSIVDKDTLNAIEFLSTTTDLDNVAKSKYLSTLLNDEVISASLKGSNLKLDGLDDLFKSFKEMVTDTSKGLKSPGILKALKGGDVISDLLSVALRVAKTNWVAWLIDLALTVTVEIFIRNTKEMFTRWLQSVQAVDVYPLKKNEKPLVAGMNGHKGSVAMYPVYDGFNSIQGMILETVEHVKNLKFGFRWGEILMNTLIVDENILNSLSYEWRNKLGLVDPDTEVVGDFSNDPDREDFNQGVYNELGAGYSNMGQTAIALRTKSRIKSYDAEDFPKIKDFPKTYDRYEIKNINASDIIKNDKIRKLYYIEKDDTLQKAIANDKLVIAHNKAYSTLATIQFEHGNERIPVVINKDNVIDAPLVQEEVIFILQKIVERKDFKGKIHFKSGARFNDENWKNTGFRFILEYQGVDSSFEEILNKVRNATSYTEEFTEKGKEDIKRYLFDFQKAKGSQVDDYVDGLLNFNKKFIITVYPPNYDTTNEDTKKDNTDKSK